MSAVMNVAALIGVAGCAVMWGRHAMIESRHATGDATLVLCGLFWFMGWVAVAVLIGGHPQ